MLNSGGTGLAVDKGMKTTLPKLTQRRIEAIRQLVDDFYGAGGEDAADLIPVIAARFHLGVLDAENFLCRVLARIA